MRVVSDWRRAHKWISMQAMTGAAALLTTWGLMPDDLKQALPSWLVPMIAVLALGLGIGGRLIDQTPKEEIK